MVKEMIKNYDITFPLQVHASEEVRDIITKLLCKDPEKRIGYFL